MEGAAQAPPGPARGGVTWHSIDHYTAIQKADLDAIPKYLAKGVRDHPPEGVGYREVQEVRPELWVKWAQKDPLAMKAFKSQWEYMKSEKMKYYTRQGHGGQQGKKLVF